jgi:hypothetical protein
MPSVNLVSRPLSVLIGSTPQNWSDSIVSFEPGQNGIQEEDCVILVSATAVIQECLANPSEIRPVLNPTLWKPGQPFRVQVENDSGVLTNHPQGYLFILQEPIFDEATGLLTVELGCWLNWAGSVEPVADVSAVALGTSTDLSVVCQRYLEAAGIPAGNINLGGPWGVSISYPLPKADNSAYVDFAGQIAYGANFRYLYQDSAGIVKSALLSTTPGTPDLSLDLATQRIDYDPIRGNAQPFETTRVVGLGKTLTTPVNPFTKTISATGTETYIRLEYSLNVTQLLGPLGSIVSVSEGTYYKRTIQKRIKQRKSDVVQGSTSNALITVDDTTEIRYYDATVPSPYPISYTFSYTDAAQSTFTDDPDTDTVVRKTEVATNYTYDVAGRCTRIVEETFQREDVSDPDGGITRRKIRVNDQEWREAFTENWEYENNQSAAAILQNRNGKFATDAKKWQLVNLPVDYRPPEGRGANAPSTPDAWDGPYENNEVDYEGEATWIHPGGATGRNRIMPPYQLPDGLAFSNLQCQETAGKIRDLIAGRYRGRTISLALSNALLAINKPLFWLAVTEEDSTVVNYLCNAVQWVHLLDESVVIVEGMRL